MAQTYKYILDFTANTAKLDKGIGGMTGMLKGAAVAAGAFFAADKIVDAARAVGEYALEISKVRTEIGTITGTQGAALDVLTGQVKALATSYGEDVSGTLKATNAIMREFAATGQTAFDILNAGFASSANAGGDLNAQVSEYATHYAEAGASAEQMLAVIAESQKMGVFGDKASDAIKEGTTRLREMTKGTSDALDAIGLSSAQIQADISSGNKSMFEVMQLVSRQLETLPQQAPAVGMALADIFGGPGEDAINFIRAFGDMDLTMQGVLKNANKAQKEWTEELAEFHAVAAQVFGGTGFLVLDVKKAMLSWVNEGIKGIAQLINHFIDLYNESMILRGAIQYIKLSFQTTFGFLSTIFETLWERIKGTGQLIKAIFTGDFKSIPDIIKNTFTGVIDNFKDFGTDVADNFSSAIESTLNPRKKVELINFSAAATESGMEAGKKFAAGMSAGIATAPRDTTVYATMETKGIANFQINPDAAKNLNIKPTLDVSDIQKNMPVYQQSLKWMQQEQDYLMEKVAAVQGAFQQGFAAIGQSVINGLGLASTGMEGFLGKLLETTIQIISMSLAQSIANSIVGGSSAGAATGPAAPIATPVFISTLIGGVLAAFASIPAFAAGGIAYGPTMGLIGEYPGAASNPEIIAPLSKLKAMLEPAGSSSVILQPSIEYEGDKFRIFLNNVESNTAKRT